MPSSTDDLFGDDDLTIRGQIGTSSVPELLRSLLSSRETGILTLRQGELAKSIFIHEGRVVYAASNDPDERLGENLLLRAKITARQYLEASKLIRPGHRLGAILVEMGLVREDDVVQVLGTQLRLSTRDVDPYAVPLDVLRLVPRDLAVRHSVRSVNSWPRSVSACPSIATRKAPPASAASARY